MNTTNGMSISNYVPPPGARKIKRQREDAENAPIHPGKTWKCPICKNLHFPSNKKPHTKFCLEQLKKNNSIAGSANTLSSWLTGASLQSVDSFANVPVHQSASDQTPETNDINAHHDTTSSVENDDQVNATLVIEQKDQNWRSHPSTAFIVKYTDEIDYAIKGTGSRGYQCNATSSRCHGVCDCKPLNPLSWRDIWIYPPNPLLVSDYMESQDFVKEKVIFWTPEVFFHHLGVRHMPCPVHGVVDGHVKVAGWSAVGPRKVIGIGQSYYIMFKRYKCNLCHCGTGGRTGKEFRGIDPDTLQHLPPHVQQQLPCTVIDNTILDNQLIQLMDRMIMRGVSFNEFVKMLDELFNNQHQSRHLAYLSASTFVRRNPQKTLMFQALPALIDPFPEFSDKDQYNVSIPSTTVLKKFYYKSQMDVYDLKNAAVAQVTGKVLSGDHTFKAAKVPVSKSQQIFEGLYSLVNEYGQVAGFWLVPNKSLKELTGEFEVLKQRYAAKDEEGPQAFFTDLCCTERAFLSDMFESLSATGQGQRVLLDIFHFMERYPVKKKHPLYSLFASNLRDAIFICSEEDMQDVKSVLQQRGVSDKQMDQIKRSYLLRNGKVRRFVPPADILSNRIDQVVQMFRAVNSEFIDDQVMKHHERNLKHAKDGCLSDPPGVDMYLQLKPGDDGSFKQFKCFRGTSQQEGYHMMLYNAFQAKSISPELYNVMLMDFVYRRNQDAALTCGLTPDFHIYNPLVLSQIKQLYVDNAKYFKCPVFENLTIPQVSEFSKSVKFGCSKYLGKSLDLKNISDQQLMMECEGGFDEELIDALADPVEVDLTVIDMDQSDISTEPIKLNSDDMISKFAFNVISRPVSSQKELILFMSLFEQYCTKKNGDDKQVDYEQMADRWNFLVYNKIAACSNQSEVDDLLSEYSFKAPSHLKSFEDIVERKLACKYAIDPFKAQFRQLQNHLTDPTALHIPFEIPQLHQVSTEQTVQVVEHVSVETQTSLNNLSCICPATQSVQSVNDLLATADQDIQRLVDSIDDAYFTNLDMGTLFNPVLGLPDGDDIPRVDNFGENVDINEQPTFNQLTYHTVDIIQADTGPVTMTEAVNLTELLRQRFGDDVLTPENGFVNEEELDSNLRSESVKQVCKICWKPRLMADSNQCTEGHSSKRCDASSQLDDSLLRVRDLFKFYTAMAQLKLLSIFCLGIALRCIAYLHNQNQSLEMKMFLECFVTHEGCQYSSMVIRSLGMLLSLGESAQLHYIIMILLMISHILNAYLLFAIAKQYLWIYRIDFNYLIAYDTALCAGEKDKEYTFDDKQPQSPDVKVKNYLPLDSKMVDEIKTLRRILTPEMTIQQVFQSKNIHIVVCALYLLNPMNIIEFGRGGMYAFNVTMMLLSLNSALKGRSLVSLTYLAALLVFGADLITVVCICPVILLCLGQAALTDDGFYSILKRLILFTLLCGYFFCIELASVVQIWDSFDIITLVDTIQNISVYLIADKLQNITINFEDFAANIGNGFSLQEFLQASVDQLWPYAVVILKHLQVLFGECIFSSRQKANLSLYWYFFVEMFSHFRLFFALVLPIVTYSVVIPLTLKLRSNPMLVFVIMTLIVASMSSIANLSHMALALSLIPLLNPVLKYTRYVVLACVVIAVSSLIVYPLMHYIWLGGAGGNANFLYASGLAYCIGGIMLMQDLANAHLRREWDKFIYNEYKHQSLHRDDILQIESLQLVPVALR
ncbi:hypothetical protein MIR68_000619 [Amoeboaphelidium protococcarum]|nr:hypothetical protein MIR68_000619 [Amoeboaphelidium protococcarum]